MSMQQLMLGVGASKKTYMDDVFSTYLWKGNSGSQSFNNGIDLSGEGGMTWIKSRTATNHPRIFDTERGAGRGIYPALNIAAASAYEPTELSAFNSNGFSVGSGANVNDNVNNYSSWSFRQAPGFFDVVNYTGNGTAGHQIAHSLASVPGMIIVKRINGTSNWAVYHRGMGNGKAMALNSANAEHDSTTYWNDTDPTASVFTLGTANDTNQNGGSYIAYVFAGGESTASQAASVDFDGSGDYLSLASTSDFTYGTGDFTCEAWVKPDVTSQGYLVNHGNDNFSCGINSSGKWFYYNSTTSLKEAGTPAKGQWTHFAVARSSGTTKIFINGIVKNSFADSHNYSSNQATTIGSYTGGTSNAIFDGLISNVRIVKGTAVYTSSFKPPTEPLTNITNTKLLCCNNSSSTTGSTVTPGTITAGGNPTASSDSPFDDPAGFVFGDSEEGVIKTGSYVGNGSSTGPEVNLGFEPQWLMVKCVTTHGEPWVIWDSMRGLTAGEGEVELIANTSNAESPTDRVIMKSTGFQLKSGSAAVNQNGTTYIFLALRRPDGYVGKPADAGTDVFAMDVGNGSSTIPSHDSGFPVDFAFVKQFAGTSDWDTSARLISGRFVKTNATNADTTSSGYTFDSNVGWGSASWLDSAVQSWMWKRHAGFDVVTYKSGSPNITQFSHNLNKVPEMMWVKRRDGTGSWQVYHKGYNGGTNPWYYFLELNQTYAQDTGSRWNNTAPTSTHFSLGAVDTVNGAASNNYDYIAMLFASVDGISKVGSYTGNSGTISITTGFQPRLLIIKNITWAYGGWIVFDTTRGLGSGNDKYMYLNTNAAQATNQDFGDISSTGFSMGSGDFAVNANNHNFIYYAHA